MELDLPNFAASMNVPNHSDENQLLLVDPAAAAAVAAPNPDRRRRRRISNPAFLSYLPASCFALMFYLSSTSVQQSHGYPPIVVFVASSLSLLGFIYLVMKSAAQNNDNATKRGLIKIAMYCLIMLAVDLQFSIRA